jgi:ABC-type transport system involved in multi-copper enzyme maturation permease subunit
MFGVLAIRHAAEPGAVGPAGGLLNFEESLEVLGLLAIVVGGMIGATAGAADAEAGVLGDLVATGRSRRALYLSRLPAAVGVTVGVMVAAFAVSAFAAIVLAGDRPTPDLGKLAQGLGALVALSVASATLALCLGTVVRSRGPVLAVIAIGQLIFSPLLIQIPWLGPLRDLLPLASYRQLEGAPEQLMSTGVALAVMVAWVLVAIVVGERWLRRAEI